MEIEIKYNVVWVRTFTTPKGTVVNVYEVKK
jgi:hypothetical protein